MINIPEYNVYYNGSGGITRIVYDGMEYKQSDIVNINSDERYARSWSKDHFNKPYPWGIPNVDDVYLTTRYNDSSNYSIHQGRLELIKKLEELRKAVSPSHPYTMKQAYYNNNPYVYEEDCQYDDPDIDTGYNELELVGWENFDEAEIVLVKTVSNTVPVYAIRLPKPKTLRPVNKKLSKLLKFQSSLLEAKYSMSVLHDCDVDELGVDLGVSFDAIAARIDVALKNISPIIDELAIIGRTI